MALHRGGANAGGRINYSSTAASRFTAKGSFLNF
jgi:hypothetical protein